MAPDKSYLFPMDESKKGSLNELEVKGQPPHDPNRNNWEILTYPIDSFPPPFIYNCFVYLTLMCSTQF